MFSITFFLLKPSNIFIVKFQPLRIIFVLVKLLKVLKIKKFICLIKYSFDEFKQGARELKNVFHQKLSSAQCRLLIETQFVN
jgi:hypothetical protein